MMKNKQATLQIIATLFITLMIANILLGQSTETETQIVETLSQTKKAQELLISRTNQHGGLDTLDFYKIINGVDKTSYFVDQTGDSLNHTDFKNKVVLLDFWHLKCKPCIVELPGLEYLNKKIKSDDFVLVTFANNSIEELESKLFSKKKFDIKIIPQVFLVSTNVYPLKILIDKNSKVIDKVNFGNAGENSIERLLKKYIPLIEAEVE